MPDENSNATDSQQPEVTRLTPEDAGCYVDGHWGQYGVAHMINRAEEFGYAEPEVTALADKHMASMGPSGGEDLTFDEHEALSDASEEAENWLNENVAPEGYSFGWSEGEFNLWSNKEWEDPFGLESEAEAGE